jgi:polyisoprenoid-binding protein YceI
MHAALMAHVNYKQQKRSANNLKTNKMANTKWALDPTHSEVQFKIKHLMVSTVTGQFKQFNATVATDGDDLSTAKVHFTADVNSIFTNNEHRDAHLRNADFFDSENHPELIFDSTRFEKVDEENYKLHGVLNMRGVNKEVILDVEFGGIIQDPWGNTRAGFSVTGKINRKAHGVVMPTEAGGALLGEVVALHANVAMVKEKELQPA